MEFIRPVTLPVPVTATNTPPRPVAPVAEIGDGARPAPDPAASFAISRKAAGGGDALAPEQDRRGFERDADSRTLVFRITDAATGDVIVQIPDEVVLKARAYARQSEGPIGGRIETTA